MSDRLSSETSDGAACATDRAFDSVENVECSNRRFLRLTVLETSSFLSIRKGPAMSDQAVRQALPTGTWSVDPIHSTVGFAVPYIAGTFQGSFSDFDARLIDGALRGIAGVASVQVKDQALAAHLQSPDFFDAERFPLLAFEAKDVSRSGDDLTIAAELTLKGHTEAVEIEGHINDPAPDPYGGERFGLQLEASVDRTEFGLNWNNPLPSGDPALADQVTIVVDLQLTRDS